MATEERSESKDTTRGYSYALGWALLGGTVPVVSKLLVGDVNPVVASGLAVLLSGAILIPYKPKAVPRGENAWLILGLSLAGATVAPILYFTGVQQSSAVNASLLTNSEVLFTAVIGFGVFHESLRRRQLAEGLLIAVGVVVISANLQSGGVSFSQYVAGNALLVGASIFWSVDNNLSRIAGQRVGISMVAKFKGLMGGGITMLFLILSSSLVVPPTSLPLIATLAVIFTAMTLLSVGAFRLIGAVRTILVFSTSSILGPVLAFLILGESISPGQVVGGALILSGVYLIQRSEISQ
jgi:drug/metabolite transporter (DMT)-like permease